MIFRRKKKKKYILNNMKKLLIIMMLALAFQANAQIKISALPAATEIDTADFFVIVAANGNVTRKLKGLYLASLVSDTAYILRDMIWQRAPIASPTFTGTVVLPSTTSIGSVSSTEIGYIDGVTSGIQLQMNAKANLAGPTFTGTVVLPSTTSIGNVSASEINSLDDITGNVQYLLNQKSPIANPTFTGTANFNQLVASGITVGFVTADEISYLDGVTEYIQDQLNAKADITKYYDFVTDLVIQGTGTVVGSVAGTISGRFAIVYAKFSTDLEGYVSEWTVPVGTGFYAQTILDSQQTVEYTVITNLGKCTIRSENSDFNNNDELYFTLRLY